MISELQEMTEKMEFWRRVYRKEHQKVLRLEKKNNAKEPDYILVGGTKCYTGK